ncbi:hybrid sensor histidine kinase/response regulator [Hydrogenophaga sp. 5NK40-0174]|uniref:ATP-binding response regulator n=1 Tax=Hydrogenophaga sp. 5NK40-0174 TaxID=3127649 RepID=UPI003109A32E
MSVAPAVVPVPTDKDRVDHEVLRLSLEAPARAAVWQFLISLLMAFYFADPHTPWMAAIWLLLVQASFAGRLFLRLPLPGLDAAAIAETMRRHQLRVLFSAFAWGSAGILLFDWTDAARQMGLTVALVSTCISFSFSATAHGPTIRRSLPLLIGPVVISLILSPHPYMWMLGLIGASFTVLMLRLVTARSKQLEENIVLRIEAQRARDDKQRFFAAASHDLRQPLQALNLYHSLMARGDTSTAVVQQIGACVQALDRLLEGILDVSRLDAGQVEPQVQPVHLPELMLRVFSLHDASARAKGLKLRLHTVDRWVLTDAHLAERILSNLLANAIRYTERGGVLMAARISQGSVRLQIIDTGPGISAEALETVFQEFAQLHNPQRDLAQGTGLGLAIVQRLSRLLEHPLKVRSVPGRGSCFEVGMNVTLSGLAGAATLPTVTVPDGPVVDGLAAMPALRVLVVEDNALVREGLQSLMRSWGFDVELAGDAVEAMAVLSRGGALAERPVDAVVSDWRLPGDMNGLDLLEAARTRFGVGQLVLLTGESEAPEEKGVTVLSKPVRPLRLRAALVKG